MGNNIIVVGSHRFIDEMIQYGKNLETNCLYNVIIRTDIGCTYNDIHKIIVYNKFQYIPSDLYEGIKNANNCNIEIEYLEKH